jgi:hypothetical protein
MITYYKQFKTKTMKKLILLLSIITICYACQKQTIEPIVANNSKLTQSACGWDGTFISDSAATMDICAQGNLMDTILNLNVQLLYLGDSIYYNGQVACKYDLDNTTKSLNYLDPVQISSLHINTLQGYKQDSILLKTKSNKYIVLVKH